MNDRLFISFLNSLQRFSEILKEPKTVANQDSAIKRFELTFELAWKNIKKQLLEKGVVCKSPRDCFSGAFKVGFIDDDPLWLRALEDRNLAVHTYNEELADDIYGRLLWYLEIFSRLKENFSSTLSL